MPIPSNRRSKPLPQLSVMTSRKEALAALQEVHEAMSLDKKKTARNKKALNMVLKGLIETMKKLDFLFYVLYNRFSYTGSMFQGLRIFNPDEFDVDIVLFFPVPKGCHPPKLVLAGPGLVYVVFTKMHLDYLKEELGMQAFHQLKKLLDQEDRFLVPQYRQWFQSVVDKALQRYEPPPSDDGSDCYKLKFSVAGPAITLHVSLANGDKFDVDLVPVFEWTYTQLPEGFRLPKWARKYRSEMDKWKIVPKGNVDNDCAWRIHSPAIEDRLIKSVGGCAKPTIRLLKALIQERKWKLPSYACKTVVMRHIVAKPRRSAWDNKYQFTRLLEVLERLRKELLAGGPGIPYLLVKKMSVIPNLNKHTRRDIAGFLRNTIGRLNKAPKTAPKIFLPSDSSSDSDSTSDSVVRLVKRNKRGRKRKCAPESFSAGEMKAPPCKRQTVGTTSGSLDGKPEGMDENAASAQRGAGPVTLRPTSRRGRGHGRRSCDQSGTNGARVKQETREAPGTEDHGAVKNHAGIDAEPEDVSSFLLRLLSHLRSTPAGMRARAQMQLLDIASSYSQGKYPKELLVNKSRDN
ncbi:cyclic GMP-AMP synthase-like receptor [Haemaphysalis longicornis]